MEKIVDIKSAYKKYKSGVSTGFMDYKAYKSYLTWTPYKNALLYVHNLKSFNKFYLYVIYTVNMKFMEKYEIRAKIQKILNNKKIWRKKNCTKIPIY